MSLAPEQTRALDYLRRKGTEASADSVRTGVARAFGAIEARIAEIDATTARRRPSAGGWSAHEVVDHLVASHRPAVEQARLAIRGEDPGEAIPAGLLSADPFAVGWSEQRAALASVHRDLLAALAAGDDQRPGSRIPIVLVVKGRRADGSATTYEWIERCDWKAFAIGIKAHTLEHLAQIERTLAADG